MAYSEEQKRVASLRAEWRQLTSDLATLAQDDPHRHAISRRRETVTVQLRQWLFLQGFAVCGVPDCIHAGTMTVENKPCCPNHAPPSPLPRN